MSKHEDSAAVDAGPVEKTSTNAPAKQASKASSARQGPAKNEQPKVDKPPKKPKKQAKGDKSPSKQDEQGPDKLQPRKKNNQSQSQKGNTEGKKEGESSSGASPRRRSRGSGSAFKPPKPDHEHDLDQVAKYAWKIYLAEISEEGVAMLDQKAAKELARRCFELATIFLDEEQKQS